MLLGKCIPIESKRVEERQIHKKNVCTCVLYTAMVYTSVGNGHIRGITRRQQLTVQWGSFVCFFGLYVI